MRPTFHERGGAKVDYYRTVTGAGRVETVADAKSGSTTRVLRVERLLELVTCADCWPRRDVQAQLLEARRSGAEPA